MQTGRRRTRRWLNALELRRSRLCRNDRGLRFEDSADMRDPVGPAEVEGGLSEEQKRDNVIRLAFGADRTRFEEFCTAIDEVVPAGTTVILRGSAVTGTRWKDGAPFDADGPGTSDLDLTLVGADALLFFNIDGFFVPGVHSRPMGEDDPDIAPALVPLREKLMAIVKRPVNIQASR